MVTVRFVSVPAKIICSFGITFVSEELPVTCKLVAADSASDTVKGSTGVAVL